MFAVCTLKPVGYSPWKPSPLRASTTNAYFVTRLHEARKTLTDSADPPVAVAREYVDLLLVLVRAWSMSRASIRGAGADSEDEPILEFCWSEDGAVVKTSCVRAELVMATQLLTHMLLAESPNTTTPKDWELAVRLQMWVVRPQLEACAHMYMPTDAVSCGMMAHRTLLAMGILRLQIAVVHQWEGKELGGNTLARLLCWATGTAKRLERMRPALKDTAAELEALLWFHTARSAGTGKTVLDTPQKQKLLDEARTAFLLLRQTERVAQCDRLLDDIAPRADEGPARIVRSCVVPKCVMLDHAPLGEMYLPPEDLERLWKSV